MTQPLLMLNTANLNLRKYDKKLPPISIVTPSFNQAAFIAETLDSVLSQSYSPLEYVVVDGASTDETSFVLESYRSKVTALICEPDSGQAEAINKGISQVKGEVFNWLNSDDIYIDNALSYVGQSFQNPDIQILCGRSILFGLQEERISSGTDIYPFNLPKTIGWARIDQPETFFRRDLIVSVGGLDERLHYVLDRHLWIKILLFNGLKGIKQADRVLVRYRLHSDSKTVSQPQGFINENRQLFAGLLDSLGFPDLVPDYLGDDSLPFLPGLFDDLRWRDDRQSIAAYILLNGFLTAYAANDWSRARWFSQVLDPNQLSIADRLHYYHVCLRIKLIPQSVKHFWNRIRG